MGRGRPLFIAEQLSPLEVIEGRVQTRAKHASIDMGERNSIDRIFDLIRDEIAT